MSRSRYAVASAIHGARGQAFLREMLACLDALPTKELIGNALMDEQGRVCALGSVAMARHLDVTKLDEWDPKAMGNALGIAPALAAEIAEVNDYPRQTPEERYRFVRAWVIRKLEDKP